MLDFDLMSDLHIETHGLLPPQRSDRWKDSDLDAAKEFLLADQKSDVCVVAGDISNYDTVRRQVLTILSASYRDVLWVDGNHEHYKFGAGCGSVEENTKKYTAESIYELASDYLPGGGYAQINKIAFVGVNGWYDFRSNISYLQSDQMASWRRSSNDSRMIKFGANIRPDTLARDQSEQLASTLAGLAANDEVDNIVVVTHTSPLRRALVPPGHEYYFLNGSYHNTLMEAMIDKGDAMDKVSTWCFGHTHTPCSFEHRGIMFACSPTGYRGENNGISARKIKLTA